MSSKQKLWFGLYIVVCALMGSIFGQLAGFYHSWPYIASWGVPIISPMYQFLLNQGFWMSYAISLCSTLVLFTIGYQIALRYARRRGMAV